MPRTFRPAPAEEVAAALAAHGDGAAAAGPLTMVTGHGSTIEHVVFTFGISGVSRTLSHQLVRHRAGVAFDQQSQRYVTFKGASTMLPASPPPTPTRRARGWCSTRCRRSTG